MVTMPEPHSLSAVISNTVRNKIRPRLRHQELPATQPRLIPGLKRTEVGRARKRLAHICIAIWETGDNHAILPEQVDTTVRAQVQRTEQFIEETQVNAANNHACETAIGLEVRSRDWQDVKSSHPRQDWLAKERPLLPMLTEGKKMIRSAKLTLRGASEPDIMTTLP